MSENIKITCPRCGQIWEKSLQEMDKFGKRYRTVCPADGAQLSLEIEMPNILSIQEENAEEEKLREQFEKASSLSKLADLHMSKNDFDKAEGSLKESLAIRRQIEHVDGVAFSLVKLGQVLQARGDKDIALSHYREGLVLFEKLGVQPLISQVKQLITSLEGSPATNDDPSARAIMQARNAAQRGDIQSAIQFQEQAVKLARAAGDNREALISLSVILYNLAGYYSNADRHGDAIIILEEVVAIDEQTGNSDLESDRHALEAARMNASLTPEERVQLKQRMQEDAGFESQLQAQLAQLPPEKRPQAEAQLRRGYEEFQQMSPEQKAEKIQSAQADLDANRQKSIDQAADQTRDVGLAYTRNEVPKQEVVDMLEQAAAQINVNEKPDSPWLEVAALCLALSALIKEESIPTIPAAYASHFSAVQSELGKLKT